jgi:hypothetical protein
VGSQTRGVIGLLSSSLQRSPVEHGAPSSQVAPWALLVCTQPVAGSQLSSVHWLPSLQSLAAPTQLPFEQVSPVVHALPSLQLPATGVFVQPVAETQLSEVQALLSLQFLGEPVQLAPEQVSFTVHSLPSLQPPGWFVCWQTPFAQVSSVQNLPSSQLSQTPPFLPQFWGELTQQSGPEMHPVQQPVPATQTPPGQEAPAAKLHTPAPLHM